MHVILAEALGMCFGVRDALTVARRLSNPTQITIRGELVHNPAVTGELRRRGFATVSENQTGSFQTSTVLITAHGISNGERAALVAAGKNLIDTTCPLVQKAHAAALSLAADGYFLVVIGKRDHVEVRGLTGDVEAFEVVESESDIRQFPAKRIGIIAQTTTVESHARRLVTRIRTINPQAQIRFENTICGPTRERQSALERLLDQVGTLVVVGGHHSNNTLQLVHRARERKVACLHIESERELRESLFRPDTVAGLTAGTSTLSETIAAVKNRLESFHNERYPGPVVPITAATERL